MLYTKNDTQIKDLKKKVKGDARNNLNTRPDKKQLKKHILERFLHKAAMTQKDLQVAHKKPGIIGH